MDLDDEFGDLYTDVLAAPSTTTNSTSFPSSSSAKPPPLSTSPNFDFENDDEEILYGPTSSNFPSVAQTLVPEPAPDSILGQEPVPGDDSIKKDIDRDGEDHHFNQEAALSSKALVVAENEAPETLEPFENGRAGDGNGDRKEEARDFEKKTEEKKDFDVFESEAIPGISSGSFIGFPSVENGLVKSSGRGDDSGDDWEESDSDDDLQILLNDSVDPLGLGLHMGVNVERNVGSDDEDEDGEDLVIVADGDPVGEVQEWGEESAQPGVDGERKEMGDAAKASGGMMTSVPRIGYSNHGYHHYTPYKVLERDQITNKLQEVTAQLEQALGGIFYDKLDISDEVREQVELVHSQFKRAKVRVDTPDDELYMDLSSLYNQGNDADIDPAILRRLTDKLQLLTIADLKQESLVLHEMVVASGGDPGERLEKMSSLLKKIKDFILTQNVDMGGPTGESSFASGASAGVTIDGNPKSPVVPDDFRCPISLELMKDPVIVATGQTYERGCIQRWLDAGHGTCPKTQQTLSHTVLTPNYVLRSLIAQWCEANGVEPPKRPGHSRTCKSGNSACPSGCSPSDRAAIDALICKLSGTSPDEQRAAAGELRLLAKRNADNRICIAEAGAIPLLVSLLSTSDPRTQEHAVTALLNLSICDENKGMIVMAGAIPGVVDVLKKGRMEARENAAATLFSLSVVDENKVMIGASGAIPALVELLSEGSQRGKKDAATALFNLCIYQGNKARSVRAGVVVPLMRLLEEPGGGMVDEALAILAILASHHEGKAAIGSAHAVPVLVELVATGSPRNRENAAAVLLALCSGDVKHLAEAHELGAMGPLLDLAQNGTTRAKRKAGTLLDHMNRLVEQQEQAQALLLAQVQEQVQVQAQTQTQTQMQAQPQAQTQSQPQMQSHQPRPTLAAALLDG